MRAGEDRDLLAKNAVPDEIGEAMNNRSPNISIHGWINKWVLSEYSKDFRNFRMELGTQTGALSLVPDLRLSNVKFRGPTNLDLEAQRSSRSSRFLTSGQGV